MAKGNISIQTENIFPIIKKWLYSDKDIFIRELVSNSCDAVYKLKKLVSFGEACVDFEYMITISLNEENKTITIKDNGIGMTKEEVEKYITEVAFSGAEDFVNKYKDKSADQIIGHFGLGFYSCFMVSDKVEIHTKSYKEDEQGVHWVSEGGVEYEIEETDNKEIGTSITLHISEDGKEFLSEFTLKDIIKKYCGFMPVNIFFQNKDEKEETPLNTTEPLWNKNVKDCTDEEYINFYTSTFRDFVPPIFWIHLNVDYPFNLKGILYFPKLKHEFETIEGQIKLFNNQVFVADNIKEVIPEYLMLLKGAIDCPDLPLNVSRSFLQNDGYVKRVSTHITKKVSDKLSEIFKQDREKYNNYWQDINPFVKYGCMKDSKFYEKTKDILIFKTINNEYKTLAELGETVYYVTDEHQQSQYINLFKQQDLDAILMPSMIDTHFISFLEMQETDKMKFLRIDSGLSDSLKENSAQEDKEYDEKLINIFKTALSNDKLEIKVENLKTADVPAVVLLSEDQRRMQDMMKLFPQGAMGMPGAEQRTLVINKNNELIKKLYEKENNLICEHIYDLALMSHKPLDGEAMTKFIKRNNEILKELC